MSEPIHNDRPFLNKIINLQNTSNELHLSLHKQLGGDIIDNQPTIELINKFSNQAETLANEYNISREDKSVLNNLLKELKRLKLALVYFKENKAYDPASSSTDELHDIINDTIRDVNKDLNSLVTITREKIAESNLAVLDKARLIQKNLLVFLIIFSLGTISILFFFSRIIAVKLKQIIEGTRQLAQGQYNWRIKTASKDEFGEVITSFNNMAVNIADSKRELKESHDRFMVLFENAPICYQALDEHGNIIEVNQTWLDELGYKKEEVLGKPFSNFIQDKWREKFKENFSRFLAAGKISGVEYELLKKDGSSVYMSIQGKAGHNPDGSFKQTYCVLQNITEQRKLESQLRQAQKMEAMGTLAGGIAHDFNNILAIITGNAELADEEIAPENPTGECLREILEASRRGKDLVKQILAFSRKEDRDFVTIHPQSIIKETLKLLRSTTPTTVSVVQDISQDCCMIKANPTRLHQLLLNLFTNAVHAMNEKGEVIVSLQEVELDADDFNQFLHVISFQNMLPGSYARLSVTDHGTGMDHETLESIFDPFFTTKDVGQGTGMGLSVVHGIIENHKGFMVVDSEPGRGSTFQAYFPISEEDAPSEIQHKTTDLKRGSEHVLLIDDEPSILKMGQRMLESLGYRVTVEDSSLKAYETFKSNPNRFDLVITDQTMPNMSGTELTEKILQLDPEIAVILCTGFSSKVSEENARDKGIKKYIHKPYNKNILSEAVREVLDE